MNAAERKEWAEQGATDDQLKALRILASESGRTFSVGITRGQSWKRISRATRLIQDPLWSRCSPPWANPS
jgi:hypothetical protein